MDRPKPIDTACKDIGVLKRDFQEMKVMLLTIQEMLHALKLRLDAHEEKHNALAGQVAPRLPEKVSESTGWFF